MTASPCLIFLTSPYKTFDVIIFNEGLINWDSTIYIVEGTFEFLSFPVNTIPQLGKQLSSALFFKLKNLASLCWQDFSI